MSTALKKNSWIEGVYDKNNFVTIECVFFSGYKLNIQNKVPVLGNYGIHF